MSTAAPGPAAPAPAAPPQSEVSVKDVGPRLPGVVDDFSSDDARAAKREIKPIRDNRTAIDRIIAEQEAKAGKPAPQEGTEQAQEQPEADPAEEPAEPTQKFVFGGVEFESQEAAEQNFRTLRGQFKAKETAEKKARAERDQAATVASQWKAEAERARAELEAARRGAPAPTTSRTAAPAQSPTTPATATEQTAQAEKAFHESVDWGFYEELHETKGPVAASFWLAKQQSEFFSRWMQNQLQEVAAPLQEQQAFMEKAQASAALFDRCEQFVHPETGESIFPELQDERAAEQIVKLYVRMGFDPNAAQPELGVHHAVLAYRDHLSRQGRAHAPSPTSTAAPAAALLSRASAEQAASSHVLAGNGTPRPATPDQRPELQLKKAIREAGRMYEGLGFGE